MELIQRASSLACILDKLFDKGVLNQESYDEIVALPTSQQKMRALYSGGLKAGRRCKDIFYEVLVKYESFLIEELKGE